MGLFFWRRQRAGLGIDYYQKKIVLMRNKNSVFQQLNYEEIKNFPAYLTMAVPDEAVVVRSLHLPMPISDEELEAYIIMQFPSWFAKERTQFSFDFIRIAEQEVQVFLVEKNVLDDCIKSASNYSLALSAIENSSQAMQRFIKYYFAEKRIFLLQEQQGKWILWKNELNFSCQKLNKLDDILLEKHSDEDQTYLVFAAKIDELHLLEKLQETYLLVSLFPRFLHDHILAAGLALRGVYARD